MQSTTKPMIDAMVSRFLAWKLPKNFTPDAGIRFTPHRIQQHDGPHWPTGTNLLTDEQAREMIEHALGDTMNSAAFDVLAERRRQIEAEGWTPEHDDSHKAGSLARAGGFYALNAGAAMRFGTTDTSICDTAPDGWPWEPGWWKPKDARRDLVKAGALILAEIERLDRIQPPKGED